MRSQSLAFGRAVRTAREAAGLTQVDVAVAMGINGSHVCRFERGSRVPTLLTMARLAKALDVSPLTLAAAALEDISGGRIANGDKSCA